MDGSLVWKNQHHQSGTLMPLGAVHPIIARSEATKQSTLSLLSYGLLRFARNDGKIRVRDLATGVARAMPETCCPLIRGRRECRARDAPAASHAKIKKHTSIVTTVTPD